MFGNSKKKIAALEERLATLDRERATLQQQLEQARQALGNCEQLSRDNELAQQKRHSYRQPFGQFCDGVAQLRGTFSKLAEDMEGCYSLATDTAAGLDHTRNVVDTLANSFSDIANAQQLTAQQMDTLNSKTGEIRQFVQLIKDVADQTNLLALNAAIEAARAGEMGRGFAVVADEVRKLSERTGQATQEIAVMIREIQSGSEASRSNMEEAVERVKSGLALAEQGGESIRQIRDSAGGVVAVVNDISQALSEQGHASEEITRHVEQIAQAAAQNAEAAGQTSGAISELHGLTGNLRQMVSRFHV